MTNKGIRIVHTVGMLAALAALIWLINSGPDEQEIELAQYCQMVHLNRSNPDLGWPDYKHTYDEECGNAPDHSR